MDPMTNQWLPTSSTSTPMMLGKYKPHPMHLQQWSSMGRSLNHQLLEAWGSCACSAIHHFHEGHIRMPTCFVVICSVVATTCWEAWLMSPTLRQFLELQLRQCSCYEWGVGQTKAITAILEQHFAKKRKKLPIFPTGAWLCLVMSRWAWWGWGQAPCGLVRPP